jgi:hypothetical protein
MVVIDLVYVSSGFVEEKQREGYLLITNLQDEPRAGAISTSPVNRRAVGSS